MIGGMILLGFFLYWLIAKKVVGMVYTETQSIIKKRIAIAIFILIPTWDVILGFPIYLYLCKYESGIKVYKTVENVEGFYVGENHSESSVLLPYEGYRFIDYKEPKNGKYYRNSWLDTNTSTECISYIGAWNYDYTQAFQSGKCIAKEEIKVGDVSRWDSSWNFKMKQTENYHPTTIYLLGTNVNKVGQIRDKYTNEILSEQFSIDWNRGWLFSMFTSIETGHPKIKFCGIDYSNVFELEHKTLKPKKGN